MKHLEHDTGFTLIEVLIATLISTVIMTTVFSAFRTGVLGAHDIEAVMMSRRGAYRALERIRLDLKNAVLYSNNQVGFMGDPDGMSFLTLVDLFQMDIWRREFAWVSYRWEGRVLVRTSRMGMDALNEQFPARREELEIPSGSFEVHYGTLDPETGSLAFGNNWAPAQNLPAAVKINMIFDGLPLERTVMLPMGRLQ